VCAGTRSSAKHVTQPGAGVGQALTTDVAPAPDAPGVEALAVPVSAVAPAALVAATAVTDIRYVTATSTTHRRPSLPLGLGLGLGIRFMLRFLT
jgi:hypothetical protein